MRRVIITAIIYTMLAPIFAAAQQKDEEIEIKNLNLHVSADMFSAVTIMEIEFYNPNDKILDGSFQFSLLAHQVVTGFSLDINGFMRQGVITTKQNGRVAYENTIRRRIDPGLLEMISNNNYRIRIYPMPAKGTRKIAITVSEQLQIQKNALLYQFPLDISYAIKSYQWKIDASSSFQPVFGNRESEEQMFQNSGRKKYSLQGGKKNIKLKNTLSFSIPIPEQETVISSCVLQDSVSKFVLHVKPSLNKYPIPNFKSIVVFWDISSSATKRNIYKETVFLEKFISSRNVEEITIVTFSNTIHAIKRFGKNTAFKKIQLFLLSQKPDGGTDLSSVNCNLIPANAYLLFSDGLNNFGTGVIQTNTRPIYCINTTPTANHFLLEATAKKTNGRYLNLHMLELNEAMSQLNRQLHVLTGVCVNDSLISVYRELPYLFDEWATIAGEAPAGTKEIELLFGDNGTVIHREIIHLDTAVSNFSRIRLVQQYIQLVQDSNKVNLFEFASKNKVVSENTSYIVLDNVNDYINYGIVPPSDLQEEYQKLLSVVKQKEEERKRAEANALVLNLKKAIELYNERIKWWSKNELPINVKEAEITNEQRMQSQNEMLKEENLENNEMNLGMSSNKVNLSEVVVVGYGISRRRDLTGSVTSISASQISSFSTVPQALQGRVAGVQVTANQGMPGITETIRIRGLGSLHNAAPLYIYDGMQVDEAFIGTINTSDIESIVVYKDIQASILFGSRAANGAIVIESKRNFRTTAGYKKSILKYKEMEDVEYVTALKDIDAGQIYEHYLNMKDSLGKEPAFYFDVAELLFNRGNKADALRVLSNLLEMSDENHQLLRAMAYMLENWKMYKEAIQLYTKVLAIKEEEPQSYRDLALAFELNGQYQEAVDLLYASLTKNWFQYEDRYRGLKSLLLNEMNAIIVRHKEHLNVSAINSAVIKALPVDLRIVVDWNKDETDIDLHVIDPSGEECSYRNRLAKKGGRLSEDFTQGYGPEEYEVKHAHKGVYRISVNYYGDRYQKAQVPSFIKLTIFKNFGKPNQTMTTETFIMNNQSGMVEISDVKF